MAARPASLQIPGDVLTSVALSPSKAAHPSKGSSICWRGRIHLRKKSNCFSWEMRSHRAVKRNCLAVQTTQCQGVPPHYQVMEQLPRGALSPLLTAEGLDQITSKSPF